VLRITVRKREGVFVFSPLIRRLVIGSAILGGMLLIAALIAASVGPLSIPLSHTASVFLGWIGIGDPSATRTEQAVIETLRVPRILLALAAGGALGVAGAVMQGLFRNPLADPGIIGVSAGGALGAVIAIAIGTTSVSTLLLPLFAFTGAGGAMTLVFFIAFAGGSRVSMATLLLAGVAVSAFLGAITSAVILFTDNLEAQRQMIFWLAGGLDTARWEETRIALPVAAAGIAVTVLFARDLNLLLVGEDEAKSLGVRVGMVRWLLLTVASLLTGTAVAFTGTIAFVGLIVPHTLRLFLGPDHRALLPLSVLGGGLFLLIADTLARTLISPAELRVGIITAFFGAPFFLFLLIKNKSRAEAL
jgi:iron complex transport system permease protein